MSQKNDIEKFFKDQLSVWPLAAGNFRRLREAETRELTVGGMKVRLQHNPERIVSTGAKLDKESIGKRPCFLCVKNRPPEQKNLKFEGRKGRNYHILVNPYPIFPSHFVIARDEHCPQTIWHHYVDMLDLAHSYTGFTIFYNGPRSGASAPDHFHFQACPRGLMPLENEADRLMDRIAASAPDKGVPNGEEAASVPEDISEDLEYIASVQEAQVYHYKHFARGVFFLRARTSKSMAKMFYRLLDCASIPEGDNEPLFNLLTWYKRRRGGKAGRPPGNTHGITPFEYRAAVVFRSRHRSSHYFSDGPDHLTMSPGCADMAGMFIVPHADDYAKLDSRLLSEVIDEVSVSQEVEKEIIWRLTRTQPKVSVGIMSGKEIVFEIISDGAGPQKVVYQEGKISYNGVLYDELYFDALTPSTLFAEPTFILHDVRIGKDFHWERLKTQQFGGPLKFIVEGGNVVAVNIIGMEDYLLSVISSEMKATAGLELLKAHAVISRSWIMSQIANRKNRRKVSPEDLHDMNSVPALVTRLDTERNASASPEGDCPEIIKWFDHTDHKLFDVCADDHCQRYQGLTMAVGENVRKAVDTTWGEVLTYGGEICDARFSKCCGGISERFRACWEDKDLPYLQSLPDTPGHEPGGRCFCDTDDGAILSQVLNDYDIETKDFFRWKTEYGREELARLISLRCGRDIGDLVGLVPLERGGSGRIIKLKIIGSKYSFIVGKELMIRRFLSETHLRSSAFDVRFEGDKVILDGRGWGHGAGLCQIGAAVMAHEGYSYREILSHYYPDFVLERR